MTYIPEVAVSSVKSKAHCKLTLYLMKIDRAEKEMLENLEAEKDQEMADVAAEAEEEAIEAARLASEAAKQVLKTLHFWH